MVAPVALRSRPAPVRAFSPPIASSYWPPGALAIAALATTGCRWPLGEVHDEAFRFCNAPRARGSYCAVHRRASRQGGLR